MTHRHLPGLDQQWFTLIAITLVPISFPLARSISLSLFGYCYRDKTSASQCEADVRTNAAVASSIGKNVQRHRDDHIVWQYDVTSYFQSAAMTTGPITKGSTELESRVALRRTASKSGRRVLTWSISALRCSWSPRVTSQ